MFPRLQLTVLRLLAERIKEMKKKNQKKTKEKQFTETFMCSPIKYMNYNNIINITYYGFVHVTLKIGVNSHI